MRRSVRAALERVGGGLWRLADHRRQCGARIEHHDQPHRTAPRSAPTIGSRRTRWPALRWPAAAPISALPTVLARGRSDLFQAGAFVRHNVGPAYISGALAYGWQDITTDRTVTVAGVDQLRAQFNANAWSGRVEGGYRFVDAVDGRIGITPYAAGQFTTFDLPAYAEQAIVRRQHLCAGLRLKERHGHAQRTRPAQRQIIRDAGWHPHPARPRGLGARFQSRPLYRRDVPDAARRDPSSSTARRRRPMLRSSPLPPK